MPVNWEEFDKDIDLIIESSAAGTDDRLASRISSITRLTDDEVKELFPDTVEAKKLTELMKIVKSEEDRNDKIEHIVSNAKELGGVILTVLQKFA